MRILINVCHHQLRFRSRHTELSEDIPTEENHVSFEVREALNKLPDKFRQVVVLFYIEEFSVKEIKAILHIPEGTIKSRLSKARDLLKQHLTIPD